MAAATRDDDAANYGAAAKTFFAVVLVRSVFLLELSASSI
jgi:hypothetical protein